MADNLSNKRIEWIDMLKGIAIILVVIRHIMQANITDCSSTIIGNMVFAVQMPLFMVVAGYFSVTKDTYYKSIKQVLSYIVKRFIHYMLPFFSWFTIVYVYIRGSYKRSVFAAFHDLMSNVDVGLWFLYVVFILSTVLILSKYISNKVFKGSRVKGAFSLIGVGILLLPLIVLAYLKGPRFLGANLVVYYYLYFALGNLIFEYKNEVVSVFERQKVQIVSFLFSLICFVVICIFNNIELSGDSIENIALRIIAAITGSMMITIATKWASRVPLKGKKIISLLGMYTLEIYVVHVQYIGLLPKGVHYMYSLDGVGIFGLALIITVALSFLTIFFLKRIPAFNLLFFGKLSNKVMC